MNEGEAGKKWDCDLLVLGASFTGIEVMHQLKRNGVLHSIDVVVVDVQAEHGYIPLMHELVAAEVNAADYVLRTAEYVRSLPRARYIEESVVSLDGERRQVQLASGLLVRARAIVIALGSEVTTPPSIVSTSTADSPKFLAQSQELRRRLAACSPGRLCVVGGGITGVEMAGELALWASRRAAGFSVALVHAEDNLLTTSCRAAGPRARRLLEAQGVEVLLNTRVKAAAADHIVLESVARGDEQRSLSARQLDCALVIWAGGIRPAPIVDRLGVHCAVDGWIEVDPSLRCIDERGQPIVGVFAGGDAVRVRDETGRWPTMNRAIECIWQAKVLARNAAASLQAHHHDSTRASTVPMRHRLIRHFPYGISIGSHSLVMFRSLVVDLRALGAAFRRWLMRRYFARYRPGRGVSPTRRGAFR